MPMKSASFPPRIALLRGETVRLGVVGKKAGKSIGDITNIGNVSWQSDNRQIARVEGRCLTGVKSGQANITASLGSMTSRPARVSVVDSIADPLRADPRSIRLAVGQGVRVGSELTVSRGDMDVSDMCTVTSLQPECVRYIPETRTLVGVSPGPAQVVLALGDKFANVAVEVLPAAVGRRRRRRGRYPHRAGQHHPGPGPRGRVRVYAGLTDRTVAATLASSDPKVVMIRGNMVCAVRARQRGNHRQVPRQQRHGKGLRDRQQRADYRADRRPLAAGGRRHRPVADPRQDRLRRP